MRVHLVHTHPEPRSFVAAMRDAVVEELQAAGNSVTVADLDAMHFNPVASRDDFAPAGEDGVRAGGASRERTQEAGAEDEYFRYALAQRKAYQTKTLAPDIREQVALVEQADILAFTFPVYWFSLPAILKGWIDRVFLAGPFYGGRRIYERGGLGGKRAFAAISLGGRETMFGERGIHGELESGMLRHFFQGTLGYVGLTVHRPFVAYHVPYIEHGARTAELQRLREYVRGLDTVPVYPVPDLRAFDENLEPL